MVNRLWQELFGIGIVETAGGFRHLRASCRRIPSCSTISPLRFQNEHAWSVKRMLRDLVLVVGLPPERASATSDKLAASIRANRLIARGPRTRLSGGDGA